MTYTKLSDRSVETWEATGGGRPAGLSLLFKEK